MSFELMHVNRSKKIDSRTSASAKPSHDHINNLPINYHDSIIHLQQTIGNQAVQRLVHSTNAVKDFHFATIDTSQPKEEEKEEEEAPDIKVGKKRPSGMYGLLEISGDGVQDFHQTLGQGGSSLDTSTRDFMEYRFGYDFSKVRIHTSQKAQESAEALDAVAYTVKNDIVFGPGEYSPLSSSGRRLLAHELTHVIQQNEASSIYDDIAPYNSLAEEEARTTASSAMMQTESALKPELPVNFNYRGPAWRMNLQPKEEHRAKVKLPISPGVSPGSGQVSVWTRVALDPKDPSLANMITFEYIGDFVGTVRWLQFGWVEASFDTPKRSQKERGSFSTALGEVKFTLDSSNPVWILDSSDPSCPFADLAQRSFAHRDEKSARIADQPLGVNTDIPGKIFRREPDASQVTLIGHFDTYLLQVNTHKPYASLMPIYHVPWKVTTIATKLDGGKMAINSNYDVDVGSAGPISSLPRKFFALFRAFIKATPPKCKEAT